MQNQVQKIDIVFLGAGPAGYQGAIRAAQLGKKAAVIEKPNWWSVLKPGLYPYKNHQDISRSFP